MCSIAHVLVSQASQLFKRIGEIVEIIGKIMEVHGVFGVDGSNAFKDFDPQL